jgi:hypothetical protein
MEGITQTEQIFMLLGSGLLMVGAGNLLNAKLRKRHCAQCGIKIGTKGKRYCPSCFQKKVEAHALLRGGDPQ